MTPTATINVSGSTALWFLARLNKGPNPTRGLWRVALRLPDRAAPDRSPRGRSRPFFNPRFALLAAAPGVSMLVAVVLVLAWSGDRTFVIDQLVDLLQRSHWDPEVLLRPTLGHLTAGGLVLDNLAFFGVRRRIPPAPDADHDRAPVHGRRAAVRLLIPPARWVALIPGLLILFYGAGWKILISSATLPNQVGMVCGLAALLALDRRDRAGDIGACILLAASVGSFSIGFAFIVGAAVRIHLEREPGNGFLASARPGRPAPALRRLVHLGAPLRPDQQHRGIESGLDRRRGFRSAERGARRHHGPSAPPGIPRSTSGSS